MSVEETCIKDRPEVPTVDAIGKQSLSNKQKKVKSATTSVFATPERLSTRIRKVSSRFADYEDVPTFTPSRRRKICNDSGSQTHTEIDTVSSPEQGKKRKKELEKQMKDISFCNETEDEINEKEENNSEKDGAEYDKNVNNDEECKQVAESIERYDENIDTGSGIANDDCNDEVATEDGKAKIIDDCDDKVATEDDKARVIGDGHTNDSQEIPIMITLETVKEDGTNE